MAEKKLHTLKIDKIVPGGLGLGRLADGIVALVRYVLPGEEVLICETEHKKDYIKATLEEVLLPSPDRIEPPCPVYGRCGGCNLQHAGPAAQLRLKKTMLEDSLQRSVPTIFHDRSLPVEEPLAAPAQFNYRQRLRLQVDSRGNYGFFHPASHAVEPVLQCLLAREQLNSVLGQLHSVKSFQNLVRHCNSFELLFNPAENDTIVLLHFRRKPRPAESSLAVELKNQVNNLDAVLMLIENNGLYDPLTKTFSANPPILSYTPTIAPLGSELILTWEAGGFCQVNLEQNSTLINLVLEMIGEATHKNILDLYCGYGNFSLPAAKFAAAILGIDSQNAAIRSAKRNVLLNGVHNCLFEKNRSLLLSQPFQLPKNLLMLSSLTRPAGVHLK